MAAGSWTPPIDIYETPDRLALRADIPGLRQEDIEVRVENNTLFIRGERRLDPQMRKEDFLRIERPLGSFNRSFSLPSGIDQGRIQAEYRDGVLEVTLAKRSEAQPRSIKIDVQ